MMVKDILAFLKLFSFAAVWLGMKRTLSYLASPNGISSLRLFLTPLICYLLYLQSEPALISALVLLIMADLSDWLDGYVARKFDLKTDFGCIYDPMCDAILHLSVFFTFAAYYGLPLIIALVFFWREYIVLNCRVVAASHGHIIAARLSGKIKTCCMIVFQYAFWLRAFNGVSDLLIQPWQINAISYLVVASGIVAVCLSVFSLFDYLFHDSVLRNISFFEHDRTWRDRQKR